MIEAQNDARLGEWKKAVIDYGNALGTQSLVLVPFFVLVAKITAGAADRISFEEWAYLGSCFILFVMLWLAAFAELLKGFWVMDSRIDDYGTKVVHRLVDVPGFFRTYWGLHRKGCAGFFIRSIAPIVIWFIGTGVAISSAYFVAIQMIEFLGENCLFGYTK